MQRVLFIYAALDIYICNKKNLDWAVNVNHAKKIVESPGFIVSELTNEFVNTANGITEKRWNDNYNSWEKFKKDKLNLEILLNYI